LLPYGPDQTLSFPEFVEFATATVDQRIDIHWQLQDEFATVPALPLNLIGKVESFQWILLGCWIILASLK
jgi:hypothetical protein